MAPRAADSTVLAGARVVLPTGTVEDGRVTVEGTRIAASAPEDARPSTSPATGWSPASWTCTTTAAAGPPSPPAPWTRSSPASVRTASTAPPRWSPPPSPARWTSSPGARASCPNWSSRATWPGSTSRAPSSRRAASGAHSEQLLRYPDPADVRKLVDAARGTARMVTLATELPGGLDSVRLLADLGVIAAIGHTDATYEQTVEAIDAGATVATHLFNAMPPLAHRELRPDRRPPGGRPDHRRADQRRYASAPGRAGAGLPSTRAPGGSR